MKLRTFTLCLLTAWSGGVFAQSIAPPPGSATASVMPANATPTSETPATDSTLAPEALDQLVAPIALYPDALVGLILPASTYSSDVVLAARYLNSDGDEAQVESQPWDDSVQALAHYPEVVKWMDENLEWTRQLGDVYLQQQGDVMSAIQRDRAQARANGTLVDTPQQKVVVDAAGNISIVPAQPDKIYVPRYDPEIVYIDRPVYYDASPIEFGLGFSVGSWLVYGPDWGRRVIWVGDRHRWHDHEWHRPPPGAGERPDGHAWHPRPDRPHPHPRPPRQWADGRPPRDPVPHPRPFPNTPHHRDGADNHFHRPDRPGEPPRSGRPPTPEHRQIPPPGLDPGRPGSRERTPVPSPGPAPERIRPAPPPRLDDDRGHERRMAVPRREAPPLQVAPSPAPARVERPGPSLNPGRPGSMPAPRENRPAPPPSDDRDRRDRNH